MASSREPILNVPAVVSATIAVMVLVHVYRVYVLTPQEDVQFLLLFAFIPARYDALIAAQSAAPGGLAADIWTFVSYAFIHGDFTHLALNSVWLLAFGSAVARRFGFMRFVAFFAVTAASGAALHLVTHAREFWPMVGASGAISGFMAAAIRFVFQSGGPLELLGRGTRAYARPAAPLLTTLRDVRVLVFLGVWFALNILFGVGSFALGGGEQSIAWEAHIGGFMAGLLLFPFFDPVTPQHRDDGSDPDAERRAAMH